MAGLLDFLRDEQAQRDMAANARNLLQATSNGVAAQVTAPVDLMAWGLRKLGYPIPDAPVGGTNWAKGVGLLGDVTPGASQIAGDVLGAVGPSILAAKAPQIAGGLLQAVDNANIPSKLSKEAGVVMFPKGKVSELPYQIQHKPMQVEGGAAPLHDLLQAFGDDVYGKHALQYYGSGDAREKYALQVMNKVRGNPEAKVTIYRGVPDGVKNINPGDWVTIHPDVAKDYGNVIKMEVPASHITSWPDSLLEFGYYPPN